MDQKAKRATPPEVPEIPGPSGAQVVEGDDFVTVGEQAITEVRADEARTA